MPIHSPYVKDKMARRVVSYTTHEWQGDPYIEFQIYLCVDDVTQIDMGDPFPESAAAYVEVYIWDNLDENVDFSAPGVIRYRGMDVWGHGGDWNNYGQEIKSFVWVDEWDKVLAVGTAGVGEDKAMQLSHSSYYDGMRFNVAEWTFSIVD